MCVAIDIMLTIWLGTTGSPRGRLGQGENLWDDLRKIDLHYTGVSEGGEDGVSPITFTRQDLTARAPKESS